LQTIIYDIPLAFFTLLSFISNTYLTKMFTGFYIFSCFRAVPDLAVLHVKFGGFGGFDNNTRARMGDWKPI